MSNGWTGVTCQEGAGFAGTISIDHTDAATQFLLFKCVVNSSAHTATISDNHFTVTALETNFADATGNTTVSVSYVYNPADTGAHTATCASSNAGDVVVFSVHQYTGSATSGWIDQHSITATSSPTGSPSVSTLNANDLIVVYAFDTNAPACTADTGFTLLDQASWSCGEAKSVTTTGSYSGTFAGASTDRWTIGIVAIKSVTGGGGGGAASAASKRRKLMKLGELVN